jgi:hypothetical protein
MVGRILLEQWLALPGTTKPCDLQARLNCQARQNVGDVGTMHAIGRHVHLDGVTTGAYKANEHVDEVMVRGMVVALARIGRCAFPQVYAVIRDTDGNSGLQPVVPMDGEGGWRVGYTVNMSVDLGNASHYDFNDGSQGYSLWGRLSWTENQLVPCLCQMFMAFVLRAISGFPFLALLLKYI